MRKTGKKSIIGDLLVLSMVLAGIGYAYWADTLNATIRAATGDFGTTFVDLGLYAQHGNETTPDGWGIVDGIGDKAYVDDTFFTRVTADYNKIVRDYSIDTYKERQKGYNSVEFSTEFEKPEAIVRNVEPYNTISTKGSHRISITINQMYPDYTRAFRTDVLNVGNIAVKLSSLESNMKGFKGSGKAADIFGIASYIDGEQYHPTVDRGKPAFRLVNSLAGEGDYFAVGGVDLIRLPALKKLSDEEIRKVITNTTILCNPATGNRMDLLLTVAMDPDTEGVYMTGSMTVLMKNDDEASQKKAVEVSIDFLWDQFNVGKDAGSPNYLVKQNKSEKR